MDPIDFLTAHAPFCDLGEDGRRALEDALEITFEKAGARLFERHAPIRHLFVVRKGGVRLELDGQQVEELGPGELLGLSAVTGETARFDAVTVADCLLYRFDGDAVHRLFAGEPDFAGFFLQRLSERLRALASGGPMALSGDLATPVGEMVGRPPVLLELDATAGDAARLMNRERVSSALVVGAEGRAEGIVTDRDLRGRVLAEGRGPETPIAEILSSPLLTVESDIPASEAVLELLRAGVHHLPVARGGEILGVLTHSDLLRRHQSSPGALYKKIEKTLGPGGGGARGLESYADDIAAMIESLHRARLGATEIGRLVAALGDALAGRLLDAAERDLGPPPCAYAWIVFGSEGRQEQSLLTDQDNALVYAEESAEAERYFATLSERVVGDLHTVGFPLCAGGFMATNWHRPLDQWRRLFRRWVREPEPEAMLEAANFFDFRVLHGGLDLEPLEEVIHDGAGRRLFIAQLARAALDMRPPLGMLHRIRESEEGVDLKAGALMPIVGLARVFALEAGDRHGSTLRRLQTARRAGKLSMDGAELLTEAFRFVFELRLRHQLRARRAGRPVDNHVHLDDLTPGERRHVKEAFVAVDKLQNATAGRLDLYRLG